jgi:DNA-binding IclR family transcriptional regulator
MLPPDALLARIRGEYREMPGLRLTFVQACRLWQMDAPTCQTLLEQLVREGFLSETEDGSYTARPATPSRQAKARLPQRVPLSRSA